MVMGTLGKYNRSVSIIGVGCTPFMYTVDNPETNGLTEGEMFGYAALKAMEDAGVNPQDVDFYFHGEASPLNGSNYLTPNVQAVSYTHLDVYKRQGITCSPLPRRRFIAAGRT